MAPRRVIGAFGPLWHLRGLGTVDAVEKRRYSRALMIVSVSVVGGFSVWQALRTSMIAMNGHCGDDGGHYCDMVRGIHVARPFKDRILAPLLVRATSFTDLSVITRFVILDIVFGLLAIGAVWLLVRATARQLGADEGRANDYALIAAAMLVVNPWMWHFVVSNPAMTDIVAIACGLWWLVAYRTHPRVWPSVVLAVLVVTAREAWLVPVVAVAVIDWRMKSSTLGRAGANVLAGGFGFIVITLAPYHEAPGHAYSVLGTFKQWLVANFLSGTGLMSLTWLVVFGLGFVPLLLLAGSLRRLRDSSWASILLVAAATHFVLAVLGGGDTDRLLMPTAALLMIVALAVAASKPHLDLVAAALITATILEWRPWQIVSPTVIDIRGHAVARGFWSFWAMRDLSSHAMVARIGTDAMMIALPLAVAAGLWWAARRRASAVPGHSAEPELVPSSEHS